MATLTTQNINRAGVIPTYAAATGGGDAMEVGSGMMLHIKNGSGGALTVTFAIPAARTFEPNIAITSPVVSIGATSEKLIGPIDSGTFSDPTTGLCTLTYSGVTTLTVAALKLNQP